MIKKRVLFISWGLIATDLAYTLKKEGCEVRLFIDNKPDKDSFDGMVEKTTNWEADLGWVGKDGLIIFDDVGYGDIQDKLRNEGYLVIGGGSGGDKLELDREYAQSIFRENGVIDNKFETKKFSVESAIAFVEKNKGKWVIKQNGHNNELNYVGVFNDGSDVVSILKNYRDKSGPDYMISLQKKVEGVEIAIGRFFNGTDWVGPSVINFEHKHFFNDDIGPLGGETGTLMWYEDKDTKLFNRTLAKIKAHLRDINYRGYIDVNCIVNKDNIYPLEITSRFGSSTIETQCEIHNSLWFSFLHAIAAGNDFDLDYKKGYSINIAITTPPFPYQTSDKNLIYSGVKINFSKKLIKNKLEHIHFEGVKNIDGEYYTSSDVGYTLYITAISDSVLLSRKMVFNIIKDISIPKMFYRTDIGKRFIKKDQKKLKKWGWI